MTKRKIKSKTFERRLKNVVDSILENCKLEPEATCEEACPHIITNELYCGNAILAMFEEMRTND